MTSIILCSPTKRNSLCILIFILTFFSTALLAQPRYQWAKSTGISGIINYIYGIARDTGGNIYLCGNTNDHLLEKYDPDGNYFFGITIFGLRGQIREAVDRQSNIYLFGNFEKTGSNPDSVDFDPSTKQALLLPNDGKFVAKYDQNGSFLWVFALNTDEAIIGEGTFDIAVDTLGDIYLTGQFFDTVDFDPGPGEAKLIGDKNGDIYIAKYDPNGKYLWARKAGSTGNDGGSRIVIDKSGNAYISGWIQYSSLFAGSEKSYLAVADTNKNFFFSKYNSNGEFQWVRSIGPSGQAIALDSEGNVYVSGYSDSNTDLDPGPGVVNFPENGAYIAKYTSDGNYVWARQIGQRVEVHDLAISNANNIYVAGDFALTNNFNQGSDSVNLTANQWNMFIAKYNSDGIYRWVFQAGPNQNPYGCFLSGEVIDKDENIYIKNHEAAAIR